jgi:hypothetical protein
MRWVVLAILLCIVPYTVITLAWRKPGRAYEPYADGLNRATTSRLLDAGYARFTVPVSDGSLWAAQPGRATIAPAPAGIPVDLATALIEQPVLPDAIDASQVSAAETHEFGSEGPLTYHIQFLCPLPSDGITVAAADIYRREQAIIIVPVFGPEGENVQVNNGRSSVMLQLPRQILPPGTYTITIAGRTGGATWSVQVN